MELSLRVVCHTKHKWEFFNTTELEEVRFGLNLAWNLVFKHVNLQIDSNMVMQWLTHDGA